MMRVNQEDMTMTDLADIQHLLDAPWTYMGGRAIKISGDPAFLIDRYAHPTTGAAALKSWEPDTIARLVAQLPELLRTLRMVEAETTDGKVRQYVRVKLAEIELAVQT